MKKKVSISVLIGIALLLGGTTYYIHRVNRINTECIHSLDPLAKEIYSYHDAHGYWPESIRFFSEDKKKTTRGAQIRYDKASLSLTAECIHPGIPLLDRLDYRPGEANYSRTESHGINLENGYKRWKEQNAYEKWDKKLKYQ